MKRIATIIIFIAIWATLFAVTFAHAETREERFEKVRKECAERASKELDYFNPHWLVKEKCRRIDSLRDDLLRCASERNRLRIAAGCSHRWEDIGPGRRWCRECWSIADFLGGEWLVVFTGGMWVGQDPLRYPENYGLK